MENANGTLPYHIVVVCGSGPLSGILGDHSKSYGAVGVSFRFTCKSYFLKGLCLIGHILQDHSHLYFIQPFFFCSMHLLFHFSFHAHFVFIFFFNILRKLSDSNDKRVR